MHAIRVRALFFFSSHAFCNASLCSNHFGFLPDAIAVVLALGVVPVEVDLFAKIAAVSLSIAYQRLDLFPVLFCELSH